MIKGNDITAIANSIRSLTMDAVQAANSGHPGMPMGVAELGALLYGDMLRYHPKHADWVDRDRFVLSAGHGSMFLYALLHLAGFDVSLEDIKAFRRIGSKTPGHPEYRHTQGVETTTGPLGQGVANAVGMAMAERFLAARFNTDVHTVVNHYTYVLAGDGCLMEGISSEASSLAGHLKLNKLIMFYDSNNISIDGSTDITFTEDVAARYNAYNWFVQKVDAYDTDAISRAVEKAKQQKTSPSLIVLDSVIAKGSVNKEGSAKAHGAALGSEEVALTKEALGLPKDKQFYIIPEAQSYFHEHRSTTLQKDYDAWEHTFVEWKKANPGLFAEWQEIHTVDLNDLLKAAALPEYPQGKAVATRVASGECIAALSRLLPHLIGGSADLAASNNTDIPEQGDLSASNPSGKNIRFGVREHAMAAISNGLVLHGGFRLFCATFLVFSDYMRPAMRLAALMEIPVVYILTHDSIHLGEDGPTHQPVEHLAALRAIPGLKVLRPSDAEETAESWLMSLEDTKPSCIILTRQALPVYPKPQSWREDMRNGAYCVQKADNPALVIIASGSEVSLVLESCAKYEEARRTNSSLKAIDPKDIHVVSMPERTLFLTADKEYRDRIVPPGVPVLVVEAGISQGWEGLADAILCMHSFGASGTGKAVAAKFGFDTETVTKYISDTAR